MAIGRGRPTKYQKDFHPDNFIALSKVGKTLAQIAKEWDIDRVTLFRWTKKHKDFRNAVKKGHDLSEAWYIDLGQQAMLGLAKVGGEKVKVNLGFYIWMTKNLFQWKDRVENEGEKDTDVTLNLNIGHAGDQSKPNAS